MSESRCCGSFSAHELLVVGLRNLPPTHHVSSVCASFLSMGRLCASCPSSLQVCSLNHPPIRWHVTVVCCRTRTQSMVGLCHCCLRGQQQHGSLCRGVLAGSPPPPLYGPFSLCALAGTTRFVDRGYCQESMVVSHRSSSVGTLAATTSDLGTCTRAFVRR
jgi:hypothetical protein